MTFRLIKNDFQRDWAGYTVWSLGFLTWLSLALHEITKGGPILALICLFAPLLGFLTAINSK